MRDGYFMKEERQWLHTRQVIAYIVNFSPNKKKGKMIKPSEIMPLNLDKVKKKKKAPRKLYYTLEELQTLQKKFGIN
jgi:hypothetical protein